MNFRVWLENNQISVYLDDERVKPPEFDVKVSTAFDAIELLKKGNVNHISLDHDLGPAEAGTGYDVIKWIEENAFHGNLKPLKISIHSANPVGVEKMKQARESAYRFFEKQSN